MFRALCLTVLAFAAAACSAEPDVTAALPPETDPQRAGVSVGDLVTRGTDEGCGDCHEEIVKAYESSGMHRAMTLPIGAGSPEADSVGKWVIDAETGIRGRMEAIDGRYVQRLVYDDPTGVRRADHAFPVDLVIGSGRAARTYVDVRGGDLYQLPLTWFRELDGLALSPGPGFRESALRIGTQLCIACHTGDVEPADARHESGFRGEIALGITCRRCHGDGTEHSETGDPRSIVNPARLDLQRQGELCFQCHRSGAHNAVKNGKSLADYVPGEPLGAVMGIFAPQHAIDTGASISGHGTRLAKSLCFTSSEDMTCTTCHDPHATSAEGDTHGGCAVCHQPEACAKPSHGRDGRSCASCHMATVPSRDVAHTSTTDHFIQRIPPPPKASDEEASSALLPFYAARDVELVNVLDPQNALPGSWHALADAYITGAKRLGGAADGPAGAYLIRAGSIAEQLVDADPGDVYARLLLARVHQSFGYLDDARREIGAALAIEPDHPLLVQQDALAAAATRGDADAEFTMRAAWKGDEDAAHVAMTFAQWLGEQGRPAEALEVVETTIARLGPAPRMSRAALQHAQAANRPADALRHAWDGLIFRPRDPEWLADAGALVLATDGDAAVAVALANEALKHAPRDVRSVVLLVESQLAAGDREKAARAYARANEIAPGHPALAEVARALQVR